MTETSRSNAIWRSRMAGCPAIAASAAFGFLGRGDARLALAVIAEPAGLEHRRGADAGKRGVIGPGDGCKRRHGDAETGTNCFSLSRSWVTRNAFPPRRHGHQAARRSSAATGTFSNSNVTTSAAAANRSSALGIVIGASVWAAATSNAGLSPGGA
jgi:hypothetical protein